jgi:phosphonate degradation associated HDIG domain protein
MTYEEAQNVTTDVFSLYEKWGSDDYIGEPVSQMDHMLQAALLAEKEGYDEEVVLAAFFHDIGHLVEAIQTVEKMEGVGVKDHEKLGADYLLEKGFSQKLCALVQSHVQAKRYLTFRYPDYYERLSDASKQTLVYQGGRMTEEEAGVFENDPNYSIYIKLREWDDKAKEQQVALPPLQYFRQMTIRHLMAQTS